MIWNKLILYHCSSNLILRGILGGKEGEMMRNKLLFYLHQCNSILTGTMQGKGAGYDMESILFAGRLFLATVCLVAVQCCFDKQIGNTSLTWS